MLKNKSLFHWQQNTGLRFAVVGGINTAAGLLLFPVLYSLLSPLGVHYLTTLLLCHFVTVGLSYFLSKHFVFRVSQGSFRQFLLHSGFHWAYLGFNLAALPAIVEFGHFDPRLVQFGISLVAMVLSYLWQKRVVFARSVEK